MKRLKTDRSVRGEGFANLAMSFLQDKHRLNPLGPERNDIFGTEIGCDEFFHTFSFHDATYAFSGARGNE